jgi:hypothetical protein
MQTDSLDDNSGIDALERDFLLGDLAKLRDRKCPVCQSENCLRFVVMKKSIGVGCPGRRIRAGISIYCVGKCNSMVSHMDGFCPAWAEKISDWDGFSQLLNETDSPPTIPRG